MVTSSMRLYNFPFKSSPQSISEVFPTNVPRGDRCHKAITVEMSAICEWKKSIKIQLKIEDDGGWSSAGDCHRFISFYDWFVSHPIIFTRHRLGEEIVEIVYEWKSRRQKNTRKNYANNPWREFARKRPHRQLKLGRTHRLDDFFASIPSSDIDEHFLADELSIIGHWHMQWLCFFQSPDAVEASDWISGSTNGYSQERRE